MKKSTVYRLPIEGLLLACLLAGGPTKAEENTLRVTLQNVRDGTGQLRASLYRDSETFRKEDKAIQVISIPAAQGEVQLVFRDLTAGRYAIMAYHDANSDGKLDLRFGMFPMEGYGLSNNPKVLGPPKFADSAFDVGGTETSVNISILY